MNSAVQSDATGSGWFATTHWSIVLAAGKDDSPEAGEALQKLCTTYWYPLYAYIRKTGRSREQAEDLTQDFFAHLLSKNYFAAANRDRGHFRSFLLTSLKNFITNDYIRATRLKRGGVGGILSLHAEIAENRFMEEPADQETPETLYERRWAMALLEASLQRLEADYAENGRSALFALLKSYVWGDRNGASYMEIAAQLDLTEESVKKAVQRMRLNFRSILRKEIAQTVSTVGEVEDELRYLVDLLRP
jgi:RNA polymerase sigma factor (sigma-70 family)